MSGMNWWVMIGGFSVLVILILYMGYRKAAAGKGGVRFASDILDRVLALDNKQRALVLAHVMDFRNRLVREKEIDLFTPKKALRSFPAIFKDLEAFGRDETAPTNDPSYLMMCVWYVTLMAQMDASCSPLAGDIWKTLHDAHHGVPAVIAGVAGSDGKTLDVDGYNAVPEPYAEICGTA